MIIKYLMKKPMLAIGILMMVAFISLSGKKFAQKMGLWDINERFNPTSCRALMVKLSRNIPANWNAKCEGNNLAIDINYPSKKGETLAQEKLCELLYRQSANYLRLLADHRTTPTDNLERTDIVRMRLAHPELTINFVTEGKYLAKLATMRSPQLISEHLKVTVQVQEVPPTCSVAGK